MTFSLAKAHKSKNFIEKNSRFHAVTRTLNAKKVTKNKNHKKKMLKKIPSEAKQ